MDAGNSNLRDYLSQLRNRGNLLEIQKPVDVQTQLPALVSEAGQPIVFHQPSGFDDFTVVDNLLLDRSSQALALGCDRDTVVEHYARHCRPGTLSEVDDAPVKEIVWMGDDLDLARLPVPMPSEGIDVPHLELTPEDFRSPVISGSISMTRHRDSGVHNCAFTMAKIVGPQRCQNYVFSNHSWRNIQSWVDAGERTPAALVIGCHPAYELGAAYTGPHEGFGELEIASSLLGEDVPLVRCETVDLMVPANAEIVIEGYIDPERAPYVCTSAHTDTYAPFISQEPFFDVTAITMRKKPIYRHIQPTRFTDHHAICEFVVAPMLFGALASKGFDVHDVAVPLRSCINAAVIQMTPRAREESKEAVWTGMTMPIFPRLTIAVDADVDIYSADDLLYALSIRVDAARDLFTLDGVRSFDLEPMAKLIPGIGDSNALRRGARYGIDATKPPLSEPTERIKFERLRPRGDGDVRLADFLD